jgi:lysozyme
MMEYSESGFALTKSFEKCRLTPYKDVVGVWTDGWGNTHGVIPGHLITQAAADAKLVENVAWAVGEVNDNVEVPLTQNQFDALVDLTFNIGRNAFDKSTILVLLNKGDYVGASEQFKRWNKAAGQVVNGLTNRRRADEDMFEVQA